MCCLVWLSDVYLLHTSVLFVFCHVAPYLSSFICTHSVYSPCHYACCFDLLSHFCTYIFFKNLCSRQHRQWVKHCNIFVIWPNSTGGPVPLMSHPRWEPWMCYCSVKSWESYKRNKSDKSLSFHHFIVI